MVEIADIRDQESFEGWLKECQFSDQQLTWLTVRVSLRAVPFLWANWRPYSEVKLTALLSFPLRSQTALIVGATDPVFDESFGLSSKVGPEYLRTLDTVMQGYYVHQGGSIARRLGQATIAVIDVYEQYTGNVSGSELTFDFIEAFWDSIREDCASIQIWGSSPQIRLWTAEPLIARSLWERIEREYSDHSIPGHDWSFWLSWYERTLNGEDQPWELMDEIAFNGRDVGNYDTFWSGTDAEVNARIMAIVKRYELREEVQRLKGELASALQAAGTSPPITRTHNLPPDIDPIAGPEELRQPLTVLWDALEEADQELVQQNPDPSILKTIAAKLGQAVAFVGRYCMKLTDITLQETAKTVGRVAGPGLVAWIMAHHPALAKLAEAIEKFAETLSKL
jgi:hypothetical protein